MLAVSIRCGDAVLGGIILVKISFFRVKEIGGLRFEGLRWLLFVEQGSSQQPFNLCFRSYSSNARAFLFCGDKLQFYRWIPLGFNEPETKDSLFKTLGVESRL